MSTTQGYEHVPVPRGPFVIRLHKNLANRSEGEAVIRVGECLGWVNEHLLLFLGKYPMD